MLLDLSGRQRYRLGWAVAAGIFYLLILSCTMMATSSCGFLTACTAMEITPQVHTDLTTKAQARFFQKAGTRSEHFAVGSCFYFTLAIEDLDS